MDLKNIRRAVAAAQTILREGKPELIIDGKPGAYTFNAYTSATGERKAAVDRVMAALGVPGSMTDAHAQYASGAADAAKAGSTNSAKQFVFDLQVVPAVTREARKRGLEPVYYIAQLALESGYGARTPLLPDGSPSFNYGGLKWNSVKTKRWTDARTSEQIAGKMVPIKDRFAVFDNAEHFAEVYFDYLFEGGSAYRYRGIEKAANAEEFGRILQKGGYATDELYAKKLAAVAVKVGERYSLA